MDDALKDSLAAALATAHDRASDERATIEPGMIAELAMWAATADGLLDTAEIDDLVAMLQKVPGLHAFDRAAAVELVFRMAEKYSTEDAIAARVTEIAMSITTPEARRASFRLAVWAASRDGALSEEEGDFLDVLQDCLEISDDDADAVLAAARR